MKLGTFITLLFLLACLLPAAAQTSFFHTFILDERAPYNIAVAYRQGVTTLLFPTAPSNFAFAHIAFVEAGTPIPDFSASPDVDFVLITKKGSPYATLRALRPESKDTLTFYLDGKAYQIFLTASADKPIYTAQFKYSDTNVTKSVHVTPSRLLNCLKLAKAYPVLLKSHPEIVENIMFAKPSLISRYNGFRVMIDEVYRFDPEDTLIFRILLENATDQEILYKPQQLSVSVAELHFDASIVDAAGIIPPRSVVPAYFGITGTANGGRNELDPGKNIFLVLVPRVFPPPSSTPAPPSNKPSIRRSSDSLDGAIGQYRNNDPLPVR